MLIPVSLLTLVVGACATRPREGPPAPVVSVTPRQPAAEVVEPEVQRTAPKPAVPVKQETRTYAYREPGTEPEPEATASPQGSQAPPPAASAADKADKPVAAGQRPPSAAAPETRAPEPKPAPKKTASPEAVAPKDAPAARVTPGTRPDTQVASAPPSALPAPPVQATAPAAAPAVAETPLSPGLPPAADGLARQAEQQRQQGDYAGAAASLERSLRIAPREAYLWNRLARVRMEQGLASQAGQLAARSNDLAGNQGNIKQDNWRIIAESRRRAGDMAGASEAEQRAGGG